MLKKPRQSDRSLQFGEIRGVVEQKHELQRSMLAAETVSVLTNGTWHIFMRAFDLPGFITSVDHAQRSDGTIIRFYLFCSIPARWL